MKRLQNFQRSQDDQSSSPHNGTNSRVYNNESRNQEQRSPRDDGNVWNAESGSGGYNTTQKSNNIIEPRGGGNNAGGNARRSNFEIPPRFQNQSRDEGEEMRRPFYQKEQQGWGNSEPKEQESSRPQNNFNSNRGGRNDSGQQRENTWNAEDNNTRNSTGREERAGGNKWNNPEDNSRNNRSGGGRNDGQGWNNSDNNRNDRNGGRNFGNRDRFNDGNRNEGQRPSWNKEDNPKYNKDGNNGSNNYRKDNNQRWNRDSAPKQENSWNPTKTKVEETWDSGVVTKSSETQVSEVKIDVGEYKEIAVVYVVSPNEFYAQLVDFKTHGLYRVLSKKLNEVCAESSCKILENCSVGAICAACFSEDKVWYRAKILSIDGGEATVMFIDYGNGESCPIDSLKILEPELAKLPARAIKCSLFDLKPEGKEWSDDEAIHFEEIVSKAHYLARFLARNEAKDGFVVDLVDSFLYSDLSVRFQLMKERNIVPRSTSDSVYAQLALCSLKDQSVFNRLAFEVGAKLKVYVSWVNFPGEFYARDLNAEADWSAFDAKLNAEYTALAAHELVLTELEKGKPCVTPFVCNGAKAWYRALILAVEGEHVLVSYVDFGNVDRVEFSEVKSLKPDFMELPAQAILLKVANLKPLGSHWKSISQADLGKYLAGDLDCEVKEVGDGNNYVVDVNVGEENVASRMIDDGLAYFEEGHCCAVSDATQAAVEKIILSSRVKIAESPALSTEFASTAITPSVEISSLSSPSVVISGPGKSQKNVVVEPAKVLEEESDLAETSIGNVGVKLGSSFEASVSLSNGLDFFYLQRSTDFERLDALSAFLNSTFGDSETEEVVNWKVGELCVARYDEDQSWYRALILEQQDFGFRLLFVDYGNIEFVTFDQIRSAPATWSHVPYLSLRCRLHGLDEVVEQRDAVGDALNELLNASESLEVRVKGIEAGDTETLFSVSVSCAGEDVAKVLRKMFDIADEENVEIEEKKSESDKLVNDKVVECVLGEKVEVYVSFIDSPDRFWLQRVSDNNRLDTLLEDLGESCSQLEGKLGEGELKIGDLGAVKFSGDDGWYRGQVERVNEEGIKVFFVDFGNSEEFEKGSAPFQKLEKEEWREEAFFAVQCELKGVEVWSEEANEAFKTNYYNKTCLAEFMERKSDGVYLVRLLDMGLDVATKISGSGSDKNKEEEEFQTKENSAAANNETSADLSSVNGSSTDLSFVKDSSKSQNSSSNLEDSVNDTSDEFIKSLVVPSFNEFAESAAVHPRSESPPVPNNTVLGTEEANVQPEQNEPKEENESGNFSDQHKDVCNEKLEPAFVTEHAAEESFVTEILKDSEESLVEKEPEIRHVGVSKGTEKEANEFLKEGESVDDRSTMASSIEVLEVTKEEETVLDAAPVSKHEAAESFIAERLEDLDEKKSLVESETGDDGSSTLKITSGDLEELKEEENVSDPTMILKHEAVESFVSERLEEIDSTESLGLALVEVGDDGVAKVIEANEDFPKEEESDDSSSTLANTSGDLEPLQVEMVPQ